jgi:5'-3' exonuclease
MDVVFIDLSYFVIHRYFAVKRWYSFSLKEPGTQAEVFERFAKSFEQSLVALEKKYKFDWSNVYLARDTPRATIWRNALFPTYKENRECGEGTNKFDPEIFGYVYETLLPLLQAKGLAFKVVMTETAEADDVIAIAHRTVRRQRLEPYNDTKILILTNDHDYIQLLDKNTTIINGSGVLIAEKYDAETLSVFLEYKIIRGDVSDNIPSIGKKIGDKTAHKLALDPVLLQARFDKDPCVLAQYELNKTLISFDRIPEELVEMIIGKLAEAGLS